MKYVIGIVVILTLAFIVSSLGSDKDSSMKMDAPKEVSEMMDEGDMTSEKSSFSDGEYVINVEASKVNWAGKKPLVEGYINSGTLALSAGTVSVLDGSAVGEFSIDMNSLSVFETPKKPGKESMLQEHLKGEGWFDVEAYPSATFSIKDVQARVDSDSTFVYDVTGDLTMKGETHELVFPAQVYVDESGLLHADASLEFDRTLWGITAGSGNFFDNLADNVVDDMVALSFSLVAEKQ